MYIILADGALFCLQSAHFLDLVNIRQEDVSFAFAVEKPVAPQKLQQHAIVNTTKT